MIRRFNYTGRQRIRRTDVDIKIRAVANDIWFDAQFRVDDYRFPPNSRVFIEAYRATIWLRFDYGRVASLTAPDDRSLAPFECADGVLFRVKVVSSDVPHARVLAAADQIRPLGPDDRDGTRLPLLPVRPESLGQEVWRLDINDRPILLVNRETGDANSLATSSTFQALVYPAILRQILERITIREKYRDVDDRDDWRSHWLRFASELPRVDEVPHEDADPDRVDDWIDSCVSSFCDKLRAGTRFQQSWDGGAQ